MSQVSVPSGYAGPVQIEIPGQRPTVFTTRMTVRRFTGDVLGGVPFEPGLVRVRISGTVRRLPREYCYFIPTGDSS